MAEQEPIYVVRWAGPELIERGREQTASCPVQLGGAAVTPTDGSVRLLRPSGAVAYEGDITLVGGVPTATLPTLASEALGEGWRIVWLLTLGGVVRSFSRDAALVRQLLYPVVSDADLIRRHSDLASLRPSGSTSYRDQLEEAWADLLGRLRQKGSLPHLIMSAQDLRSVHMYMTLALIFRDFTITATADSKWSTLATYYDGAAADAFKALTFKYDPDLTGTASTKRAASPAGFLTEIPPEGGWW